MATNILISIYPELMPQLESGIKNFEFRPFVINDDSITMWLYETKPTKLLNAVMNVKPAISVLSDNQHYGLGDDKFYEIINTGRVAYEITSFRWLDNPIDIKKIKTYYGLANAPQNFVYLQNYPKLLSDLKDQTQHQQSSLEF